MQYEGKVYSMYLIRAAQINQKQQIMHNNQRISIAVCLCEF